MTAPKLLRLLTRRRPRSPDGSMPLREHLVELRSRLVKAVLIVGVGTILGWIYYPPLLRLLKRPYCALPASRRLQVAGGGDNCALPFFGPTDGFVLRFKVAIIAGAIVTAPFWLYQLWAFVTPGLKRNERRYTVIFVLTSSVLFAAGSVLAYLTLDRGLSVIVGAAGPGTVAVIEVTRYLGFVTMMLVVFGISFELPLLVVMLNMIGVLPYRQLAKWQRMSIFLIFVLAAVVTPNPDPITMCLLAVPMVLLFEASVLVAWMHDRRMARRLAAESFANLPDDQASPRVPGPSALDDEDETGLRPGAGPFDDARRR